MLLLLFNQLAFGQQNLMPGYIIANNNEKIHGMIDAPGWMQNPDFIRFTAAGSDSSVKYMPEDIKEFGFTNFRYIARDYRFDISPFNLSRLNTSPDPIFEEAKGFLQVLVSGTIELYYLKDNLGKEHFFIGNGEKVDLLLHRRFRTAPKYGSKWDNYVYQSLYKGTIDQYFNDCPHVYVSDIEKLEYSRKSLTKFFTEFGKRCQFEVQENRFKPEKRRIYGLSAGVKATTISFKYKYHPWLHYNYPDLVEGNFNTSINPVIGLYRNTYFPWHRERWSWYREIKYHTTDFKGKYQETDILGVEHTTNIHIRYNTISLKSMWQFNHHFDKLSVFAASGLLLNSRIFKVNEKTIESSRNGITETRTEQVLRFPSGSSGIILSTGITMNRVELRLNYEFAGSMAKSSNNLYSKVRETSFIMNYRLW